MIISSYTTFDNTSGRSGKQVSELTMSGGLFQAWNGLGASGQTLTYQQADALVQSVRSTTRYLLDGPDEGKLSPALQQYLDQVKEHEERKRQIEDALIKIGRGIPRTQPGKSGIRESEKIRLGRAIRKELLEHKRRSRANFEAKQEILKRPMKKLVAMHVGCDPSTVGRYIGESTEMKTLYDQLENVEYILDRQGLYQASGARRVTPALETGTNVCPSCKEKHSFTCLIDDCEALADGRCKDCHMDFVHQETRDCNVPKQWGSESVKKRSEI